MSIPSSSARRRNAPNLISPLQRAQGFGVRPGLVLRGEVGEHGPLELARSGRRSRTGTRRSGRSRPRPAGRSDRSSRDRRRRGGRGACASPARRSPARGAGRRRPRNRRRRTSRPARRACDEAISGAASLSADEGHERETVSWRTCSKRGSTTSPAPRRRSGSWNRSACWRPRAPVRSSRVLEAAEAAAGRGLWVAGFVSYEAAPGLDPALVVRPRDPEDAFAALPARVVRDVRARRGDHAAAPPRRGGAAGARRHVGADDAPRAVRVRRRADPRADRGRRDLPGQPHDAPALPRRRRRARPVPRPLLRAAGRVLGLPRPRPVPRALRLARAVLRAPRRRDRDQADEGNRAARTVARGGSRRRRRGCSPPRRTARRTR